MLGTILRDPLNIEGGGTMAGMGLLPCETEFTREKQLTRASAEVMTAPFTGAKLEGYEIHMGRTDRGTAEPFCCLSDGREDGAASGLVFGTYLHGLFDSGALTDRLAAWLMERKGLTAGETASETHEAYQSRQLDLLADSVRANIDLDAVYRIMDQWGRGGKDHGASF